MHIKNLFLLPVDTVVPTYQKISAMSLLCVAAGQHWVITLILLLYQRLITDIMLLHTIHSMIPQVYQELYIMSTLKYEEMILCNQSVQELKI